MKKIWLGILATMLVVVFVAPSFAWEFSMTGEFEWRQQYFSRTGNRDIFGDANAQESVTLNSDYGIVPAFGNPATPGAVGYIDSNVTAARQAWVGFAGPNIYLTGWMNPTYTAPAAATPGGAYAGRPIIADSAAGAGVVITRGGFSRWGSDAWIGDQRLTFVPSFKVNNAIRVHGTYTVGGLRHKYAQRTYDAFGQIAAGAPPFERYYMHHTSEAAYNTAAIGSWEQVRATIQLPIATFSFGIKDFPFGTGIQFAGNTRTDSFLAVVPYGPFRLLFAVWPGQSTLVTGTASFDTVPDRETKNDYRYGPLVTYENGPLWLGFGGILTSKHVHPRYSAAWGGALGGDAMSRLWAACVKYNNGRFFFNAEFDTVQIEATRIRNLPASAEQNKFIIETGAVAGPAKVTLMTAWASGSHDWQQANEALLRPQALSRTTINYQALQPYSFLMFPTYAGGNNAFNLDGTGEMSDAYCFAGRLDYAAAANLNLFGSYIWASRVEQNGYRAGSFNATSNTVGTGSAWKAANTGIANLNPYVDDSYIGWEAQAGLDWKLLEAFTMNMAYSYWQPGPWFDQAYQAFTAVGNGLNGNGWMTGRDAIQSIRGALVINF